MKTGISVIIPSYQEAENLKVLIPILKEKLSEIGGLYEILCVDTMEPMDDTETVCDNYDAVCVRRTGGNNYGDAIRTGFNKAQFEYCVVMDGDGSHDPKYIKDFYSEMNNVQHDLIIGSRYTKGGDTENPFVLKVMSYILNVTYRVLFGISVKDISDSYRMYKTEQVKELELECDNFDIVEEILIKLMMYKPNYDIKEIPIYFEERKAGVSKRSLWKFVLSYLKTIKRLKTIQKKFKSYTDKQ